MSLAQSEFFTVQTAIEATAGTLPAAPAWMQLQVNPSGVADFFAAIKTVERDPLSSNLMKEHGEIVDLDAAPKLTHDLNKDLLDRYQESIFRSTAKYPGGTGIGRWQKGGNGATCTAVTATGYTVSASGAIFNNVIIFARGFTNAANNGLKVTTGSVGTEVKTSGLVVEAAPPAGAMIEVVGYQGAAGDLKISAGGHLTSVANVLASLGLQQYAWIWVGGGTAAAPGLLGFSVAADRGPAQIDLVAAGQLTLSRTSAPFTVDAAGAQTIQIFFGPWLRNVPGTHGDYKKTSHSLELIMPNIGAGSVTDYLYGVGCGLDDFGITVPLGGKITAELGFVGFDVQDPTVTQTAGAAASLAPQNVAALATANQMKRLRATNTDGTAVLVDIQSWKWTVNNNITPYKKQGVLGAADLIYGKWDLEITTDGALAQDDALKAMRDFRTVMFEGLTRNNDCAVLFDAPSCKVGAAAPQLSANDAARFSPTLMPRRDPVRGYIGGMTQFPYLPAS